MVLPLLLLPLLLLLALLLLQLLLGLQLVEEISRHHVVV
jgi:hypothetical protein